MEHHNALQQVTLTLGNVTIAGFSISGLATYVQVPSLGVCFDMGECPLSSLSIDHVSGDGACFDIDVTYPAFGTVGRGTISADGRELRLELYFQGQATGQRCADGQPGAATVSLSGTPFSGDAVQIFRVSP